MTAGNLGPDTMLGLPLPRLVAAQYTAAEDSALLLKSQDCQLLCEQVLLADQKMAQRGKENAHLLQWWLPKGKNRAGAKHKQIKQLLRALSI